MDKLSLRDKWIVLSPAYGRDYTSKKKVLEDFHNGKDFILNSREGSTYINKEQIPTGTTIEFRYNSLRSLAVHRVSFGNSSEQSSQ